MTRPKKTECHHCGKDTSDYYVIKTNKGNMYRCAKCFEVLFCRQQRDDYSNQPSTFKPLPKDNR